MQKSVAVYIHNDYLPIKTVITFVYNGFYILDKLASSIQFALLNIDFDISKNDFKITLAQQYYSSKPFCIFAVHFIKKTTRPDKKTNFQHIN